MKKEAKKALRHNQLWRDEEIQAAVDAYIEMFERHLAGEDTQVRKTIEGLLETGLKHRSRKAAEFRICNISYVHSELCQTHLPGFKPLSHVSPKHQKQIAEHLADTGILRAV